MSIDPDDWTFIKLIGGLSVVLFTVVLVVNFLLPSTDIELRSGNWNCTRSNLVYTGEVMIRECVQFTRKDQAQ